MALFVTQLSRPSGHLITLYQGDLLEDRTDALVCPVNDAKDHGGGLPAEFHRHAGPGLAKAYNEWVRENGEPTFTSPALTPAGDLGSRWVIHAMGPSWGSRDEDRKLRNCYLTALELATERGLRSLSFPAISTGYSGFPNELAASIAVHAAEDFYKTTPHSSVHEIRFTLNETKILLAFRREFDRRKR